MSLLRKLKLPTLAKWNKDFRLRAGTKAPRAALGGKSFAVEALDKLHLPVGTTALELYPGLGVWTAAMASSGLKKVISLEPHTKYYKFLQENVVSDTIEYLKEDGYDWDTYPILRKRPDIQALLGDEKPDWSQVHPSLFFTGTLPKDAKGEQLLAQFASCLTNRMAMYSWGRLDAAMWMPDVLYRKMVAPPGSQQRCKMSVVFEACADTQLIHSTEEMYPKGEYHLVQITPREKSCLTSQWDVFEYVLKHLFVMQRQPLSKMVRTLGPGADIILKRLDFDPSLSVGTMTVQQIDQVAKKFEQWPLRPHVLFEDDF
ncbi:ribosomal RNA adenine methyltransferase KsgA/Erm [Syncephalastrum racemosum]|uniref:rRNA adenine N(6)-methyltransferase n=1 Tax=Syncephalastrum racemosum TaxID=13706 RepID=A0A1X2HVH7_SYNRA|nr:ribosomal RNA adenine methyltransferase KsgA/Erm [Syncephalastrum racemosum]